ncbi:MAG: Prolyl oligopeptidase [candidate division Zixibacteria bacterium RBG-1]|nr:MAG: Prolyl oligopeptidase [candidate division Zixibacteria bacterium RBG-1]
MFRTSVVKRFKTLFFVLFLASLIPALIQAQSVYKYPASKAEVVYDTLHGVVISDQYRWLEKQEDSAVEDWVAKETQFTRSILDTLPHRDEIYSQLKKLYDLTTISSPSIYGEKYFFFKREAGQNHSVVYVREGNHTAPARVVLDPNTFSTDGTVALDWMHPSPEGELIAYGKSEGGSEISTLYLRDVTTGKDLDLKISYTRAASVAWLRDLSGFYYTHYPKPGAVPEGDEKYFRKVYFHKMGDNPENDQLIFGEGRPKEEWCDIELSSDHRYLMLSASLDWTKNDLWIRGVNQTGSFIPIAEKLDGSFGGDVFGNTLYLLTNYQAPRYKIMTTPVNNPKMDNWEELVPEQKGVIRGFRIVGGKLVLLMSEDVASKIYIYSLDGKKEKEIPLPTLGSVGGIDGKQDGDELFFSFTSYFYPPTVYRYDMKTGKLEETDKMQLDFDLSAYEVKQMFYNSKDGTKIPMFIVNKKGLKLDGNNPTLLYGYGGFDISLTPSFIRGIYVWLDRGGVYAVANIRGGGEYGRTWHEAGRLERKQNVYDDFIAAGEWLIANKYTNNQKLAIQGGSNGGLLMGAMLTQRPDLFKAVVCQVPLLDMLRYEKFKIARLWIPEYGSASDPAQFKWLYAYSPYQKVKEGTKYPATMITTGVQDSRVDPMHAFKMTALLQKANSGPNPILLRVEPKAGHGAGKPVSKILNEQTDIWAFLLWQLGVDKQLAGK